MNATIAEFSPPKLISLYTGKLRGRRLRHALKVALLISGLQVMLHAAPVNGRLDPDLLVKPIYEVEGDAFVGRNGKYFNNRPLYSNQSSALVIAGDRPLLRFGSDAVENGTFIAAYVRGGHAVWLHDFSGIVSKYRPGRMEWQLQDAAFASTRMVLEAAPLAQGVGVALHLMIENSLPGDRLIWACGGATEHAGASEKGGGMQTLWDVTTGAWSQPTGARRATMTLSFAPNDCRGNCVLLVPDGFETSLQAQRGEQTTRGLCSAHGNMIAADAGAWLQPLALISTAGGERPIACAVVPIDGQREIFWSFTVGTAGHQEPAQTQESIRGSFAAARERVQNVEALVTVGTPDPRLDALVAASTAVIDGVFRNGVFTHSGMRWGVPLLGWRTLFGGTVYGWHDRVKTEARLALAKQILQSEKSAPKAEARYGLTSQAPESRMFGQGRVDFHQPFHYDMQTQFFDQLIHAWRWTGDAELERMLRPALELHLDYIHDCYDPDDDGLYESYANTWPTDDQWYNGAGTAEETAYAYTAEKAATELAHRAGDNASELRHAARVAKIHDALLHKLWVPGKDYVGASVEQGGHERLHEDAWLYATFCPIDAGMLTTEQAAQSLYYSEWGLEREKMPYGGQRCWTSNWVPSKWSLREMWPGDNYALALAYFQTGLADEGWDLMRGNFPAMAQYGPVAGDLGYPNGGTDFNDCASQFCRAVVEGLFGYRPDYPHGVVTVAPQLPADWHRASIRTPDFSLHIDGLKIAIRLTTPAALHLQIPIHAEKITGVSVDGKPALYTVRAGYGCTIAEISIPWCQSADVIVAVEGNVAYSAPAALTTSAPQAIRWPVKAGRVVQSGAVPTFPGHHWVEQIIQVGELPQRRVYKVEVAGPESAPALALATQDRAPVGATWSVIPIQEQFNADVRAIFKQQYISPRPNTCSLRLGVDGYSTWQMMLGPNRQTAPSRAPAIDLLYIPQMLALGRLTTPGGIPFAWDSGNRNIAFTSMWDNWPRQLTAAVNRKGEAIWLLVCGFTNPMQGRIANAELRFIYADGVESRVALVPPLNFWSLCPFGGSDYDYNRDGFALPVRAPAQLQLGHNCRAIILHQPLRRGVALKCVTLETLSQEVMVGLMAITIQN